MTRKASCRITGPFVAAIALGALALLALFLHASPAGAQDRPDPDGAGIGQINSGSYHYNPAPPASTQPLQDPAAQAAQQEIHSYHYDNKPAAPQQMGSYNASTASAGEAPVLPKKADVPFRTDSGLITAEYYLSVGKYAEALSVLKGVMQRHPDDADAYTYRGYAYEKLGDLKSAEADYRRALLIDPRHLGANRYIASLYLRQGDLQRALEQMQVIRMVCGPVDCAEQDELEAEINRYKNGQKADTGTAPAAATTGGNDAAYGNDMSDVGPAATDSGSTAPAANTYHYNR